MKSLFEKTNINLMNEILNTTEIEYLSLSRPLLAEPDLINKWMDNKDYKQNVFLVIDVGTVYQTAAFLVDRILKDGILNVILY